MYVWLEVACLLSWSITPKSNPIGYRYSVPVNPNPEGGNSFLNPHWMKGWDCVWANNTHSAQFFTNPIGMEDSIFKNWRGFLILSLFSQHRSWQTSPLSPFHSSLSLSLPTLSIEARVCSLVNYFGIIFQTRWILPLCWSPSPGTGR